MEKEAKKQYCDTIEKGIIEGDCEYTRSCPYADVCKDSNKKILEEMNKEIG